MDRNIILKGDKASLGMVQKSDLPRISSYMNDRSVRTFLRDPARLFFLEDEEEWYERIRKSQGDRVFAIIENDDFSGLVSLHELDIRNGNAYVAYSVEREKWGRGLATEAVYLVVKYAFEYLNLRKLHSSVMEPNTASSRVLVKNGFRELGRYQKNGYIPGYGYVDEIYYELMNNDFIY